MDLEYTLFDFLDIYWAIPFNNYRQPPIEESGGFILKFPRGQLKTNIFQKIAKIRSFSDIQGGKNDILEGV